MDVNMAERAASTTAEEAGPIMETNGSSIVSKRSVEHIFYERPHFLRYFVKKRKVRAPLINRGYWLRMQCIEKTVLNFVAKAARPSLIINLGAGYDALPFRLLSKDPETFQTALFLDVDYAELIDTKVKTILAEPVLRKPIGDIHHQGGKGPLKLVSEKYWALGCDLHDLQALKQLLADSFADGKEHSIILISEVATCYMEPSGVDALFEWFSRLDDVTLCLLEQHLPCGPCHPFAETMLNHFQKQKSPLRGIKQYPTMYHQWKRFRQLGWREVDIESLWQFWCNKLTPRERQNLDVKEPFDEWEEFALFTCHYFLLVAKAGALSNSRQASRYRVASDSDIPETTWIKGQKKTSVSHASLLSRRFGALYHSDQNHLHCHGGHSGNRKNSTVTISLSDSGTPESLPAPPNLESRVCHTVTKLNESFDLLLVGGRASPERVFSDCWARLDGTWKQTAPLPLPLYRHSATPVRIPGSSHAVLVFGGRTKEGHASAEWFLWRICHDLRNSNDAEEIEDIGSWSRVTITSPVPLQGRFAAGMAALENKCEGILLGGVSDSGTPLREIFIWRLHKQDGECSAHLEIIEENELFGTVSFDRISRFGALLVPVTNGFALTGGVGTKGLIPQAQQVIFLQKQDKKYRVENADVTGLDSLLVGHMATWDGDKVYLVGGGATCFAFGAFNNTLPTMIREDGSIRDAEFSAVEMTSEGSREIPKRQHPEKSVMDRPETSEAATEGANMKDIRLLSSITALEFTNVLNDLQPVLLKNLDFGPCTELWSTEHLVEAVGFERKVSIHQASNSFMAFQPGSKNFKYVDRCFGDFMDSISNGGEEYFRALSHRNTSTPANLSNDFPALAEGFRLPDPLAAITQRLHSSVLRISGPVAMWLHYDVLANILVQVRGEKKLILFPPSDVSHLDVPAGSSSSKIAVSELLSGQSPHLKHTHPHRVVLAPGDALFIPPLWLHCAIPNSGVSVAVNVFFRNMENGYAAGRDAYGNRDVEAYEEGRRDLAKVVKRFSRLPPAMADFYLQRLGLELREQAAHIAHAQP